MSTTFIAVLTQKTSPKAAETPFGGYFGETAEEAAVAAEKQAAINRKSYPGYTYKVYVGKATHEVKPPDYKIELTEL